MKYKGKKIEGKNSVVLVLPRGEDKIVFIAQAMDTDDDNFNKLVTLPEPPTIMRKGGIKELNITDPVYIKQMDEYAEIKTAYMMIMSLKESPDLEWETIDYEKPSTWKNWQKELKDSGFTEVERMKVLQVVMQANSLDEALLEQARSDFLQEQALQDQ